MRHESEACIDAPSRRYTTHGKSAYDMEGPAEAQRHFNALEHTENVLDASRALSERVQSMVTRFIGAYPIPAEGRDVGPSGPGIFSQLHRISDETGLAIRKANEALDRLEKELA